MENNHGSGFRPERSAPEAGRSGQPEEQGLFGLGPGPSHGNTRFPMQMPIRTVMQASMGPTPRNPESTSNIEPNIVRDRSFTVQDEEDSKRKEREEHLKKWPTRDISDEDLAAEMKRIFPSPQNETLMGNSFPPARDIDDPDARKVKCRKPLSCGHLCQDPLILNKSPCGFCRFVKDFTKPCGHTTVIFCGRNESLVPCTKTCENVLLCGHTCAKQCHFGGISCLLDCGKELCQQMIRSLEIGDGWF